MSGTVARLKNFCGETISAPGTGPVTFTGAAIPGGRTFAASYASGAEVYYFIHDSTNVEVGIGKYALSGGVQTMTRTRVLFNSLGTLVAISFPGVSICWSELPAERTFYFDDHLNIGETFRTLNQTDWVQFIGNGVYTNTTQKAPVTFPNGTYLPCPFDTIKQNTLGSVSGTGPYTDFTIPSDGFYWVSWKQGVSGSGSKGGPELAIASGGTILKRANNVPAGTWYGGIEWFGFLAGGSDLQFLLGSDMLAAPGSVSTGSYYYAWFIYGAMVPPAIPTPSGPGFGWANIGLCEAKVTKHMG